MKWLRFFFITIAVFSPLIFFWVASSSIIELNKKPITDVAVAGKLVWQREGCVECHGLFGNGGYNASDLTHEFSQRGEEWLQDFFLYPSPMRPHQKRKHSALNWDDTADLIEFLRYVDSIPVWGWPPLPRLKSVPYRNGNGGA